MTDTGSPFSPALKVLAGAALLLATLLLAGYLLPSTWEASAERRIDAPPERIMSHLETPEAWRAWTPWPDSGLVREGPARGAGARVAWDAPELGRGSFTLLEVIPTRAVTYEVRVGDHMRTRGHIELVPDGAATVVRWTETGDLGPNPLMGYWARFMPEAQSAELAKSLERLEALVVGDDGVLSPDSAPS